VEELKLQVENGTYKLNAKETAESFINFYHNK
jgi:negative regulator of flagellin synthesis FlgM